jgi:arylsulfatase A-like enzyme
MRRLGLFAVAVVALAVVPRASMQPASARRILVIVVDGLRPDYITPDLMPRLSRLGQRGMTFRAHHSVFPTVTRVNGSSFVTGAYPETHGIVGNVIYMPKVNVTKPLDAGSRDDLIAIERSGDPLLTAPTLGELLEHAGKRLMVVSSGTSGSAYLLNHAASNGVIVHPQFTRPESMAPSVLAALGPPPPHALPDAAEHRRAVDAYIKFGLGDLQPDVTFMWLSDPDSTAHQKGIGGREFREALAAVDAEIGRVEEALRTRALLDRTDILVTSDHGFATHTGELRLETIVKPFARTLPDGSPDLVVAEGAIHFRGETDPARVSALVVALQRRPEVGAIFTRSAQSGTLSLDVARGNHPRAGEILVSANWSAGKNEFGYEGTTTQTGVAGHGASSPSDVHNTLIAIGPDFRQGATSDVPTGNVDIAPTILRLLGLDAPATMTGRSIAEALRDGPPPSSIGVEHSTPIATNHDRSYNVTAYISVVDGHRYLDYTEVTRNLPSRRPAVPR